jgi:hypothetical protein
MEVHEISFTCNTHRYSAKLLVSLARLEADPHRPRVTKLIGQKEVWRISSYGPRHVASISRAEQASSLLR